MKKTTVLLGAATIFFLVVLSGVTGGGSGQTQQPVSSTAMENDRTDHTFYFVHITDTHVMSKLFDRNEVSKKRLRSVLDEVCVFPNKPAFIVITGDLTNWGGNRISGALNCRAFARCFYEKNNQFYADEQCSVPVYTTPGNHEYSYNRNLSNYHRLICPTDRYIVSYQDVSLFFMNSGPNYFDEVYNWFDNIQGDGLYESDIAWLSDSLEHSNASIKIVLMHHPAVNVREANGKMREVLARNREAFVTLCEEDGVEAVLAGHTHVEQVMDGNETPYVVTTSLNCSLYPTLFVQTDDCKQGIHFRNVSILGADVWVERCVEVNASVSNTAVSLISPLFFTHGRPGYLKG